MRLEETNFYKEKFSSGSSRLKVYYGIDKLNKIMTKPAVSIVFENVSMILYCWTDIPNPEEFMQKKYWPVEYNQGFN